MRSNRSGVRFAFPVLHELHYCQLLLQRGFAVVIIRETEAVCDKLRQRLPVNKLCICMTDNIP